MSASNRSWSAIDQMKLPGMLTRLLYEVHSTTNVGRLRVRVVRAGGEGLGQSVRHNSIIAHHHTRTSRGRLARSRLASSP